ncbi:HPt (histidine-containing phosphotransfer) domain-containing protein [Friedmanniella endophytica]|uniref:HPt (Histidine-containing phosphotransfer) domain-containing protein n=1 Tax=Microlunatus kandeliicorticis TaxID=1759536 RepID=A0A7W3IQL1_9ACTN|nr:Hpt domain-containing protein [Microlunatus kandeliicorticis]MBA8793427.1 HPt (histidine-containing phosphotransfer) domain-containing protein [Microlunatus kandeliicorticis]
MSDPGDQLRDRLRMIAEQAHRSNLERAEQLGAHLRALAAGRLDEEGRAEAWQVAHKLAGSAGTFGYRRASDLARSIEHALQRGTSEVEPLTRTHAELVAALAAPADEPID